MKMPFLSPPSLKEICKLFLVKKGIARIDLPSTLAEEVEELEGRIKSIFTGTFHGPEHFSVITMSIAWTQGQWEFTMKNQETLVIKSGVKNSLGKLGGKIFLLPGRTVTIYDFSFDLGRKTLSFDGMYSSIEDPRERLIKITLGCENENQMRMKMFCRVSNEGSWYQLGGRREIFIRDNLYDHETSDSDLEGLQNFGFTL